MAPGSQTNVRTHSLHATLTEGLPDLICRLVMPLQVMHLVRETLGNAGTTLRDGEYIVPSLWAFQPD
jgi:hypothetical protein